MLRKGELIPDITLENQDSRMVSFAGFKGSSLVVYFYPKNNTRVCTAQLRLVDSEIIMKIFSRQELK